MLQGSHAFHSFSSCSCIAGMLTLLDYSLFITLPAVVVVLSASVWAFVLVYLIPPFVGDLVSDAGAIVTAPPAARFMVGALVAPFPEVHPSADPLWVTDLEGPLPPPTTLNYSPDLHKAEDCQAGGVQESLYLDAGASLTFIGTARDGQGAIRVTSAAHGGLCLQPALAGGFRFTCPALREATMATITYDGLEAVTVTAQALRRGAPEAALCVRLPCAVPVRRERRQLLVLPRAATCAATPAEPMGRVYVQWAWGQVCLTAISLQMTMNCLLALGAWVVGGGHAARHGRRRGPRLGARPHTYSTFAPPSPCAAQEPEGPPCPFQVASVAPSSSRAFPTWTWPRRSGRWSFRHEQRRVVAYRGGCICRWGDGSVLVEVRWGGGGDTCGARRL